MEESKQSSFIQTIDKPIYDVNGKELKVGMKVKILISEFDYPAGLESEIIAYDHKDYGKIWATTNGGVTSFLGTERAKNYEIVE